MNTTERASRNAISDLPMLLAAAALALATTSNAAHGQIRPDEELILFPTAATRSKDGASWNVPVHGWVYEPESSSIARRTLLQELADQFELKAGTSERRIFQERASWLLVDNERGKQIEIGIGDERFTLPHSAEDGHFEQVLSVPGEVVDKAAINGQLTIRAILPPGDSRKFTGSVRLVPPTGWTVISDIDDTVKISEVRNRARLLHNTFAEPFTPVEGMAARYTRLAAEGAVIHFVSSSPWQLYPPLQEFFQQAGFPPAVWHLKRVWLGSASVRLLLADPYEYKLPVIEAIVRDVPGRKVMLIGDSAEKDPEIYGEVARRFPDRVLRIAIRDVTGEDASSERYDKAFRDVPRERWQLFQSAAEIRLPDVSAGSSAQDGSDRETRQTDFRLRTATD